LKNPRSAISIPVGKPAKEKFMADAKQGHHHPDYDQRIKAIEEQTKKLQQQVRELQQKLETHDHPHTHSH